MITLNNENYLTVTEALTLLQISKMTLWRWVKEGKVEKYQMSARKIFFKESSVQNILIKK